jgi:sodium-independent sulfate anion transporter 11
MIATTSIKGKFEDLLINKVLHANTSEQQSRTEALQQHAKNTHIDPFLEDDPTVKEWLSGLVPTRTDVAQYTRNLFPSSSWVRRYNLHWLIGDAIAGEFLVQQARITALTIYKALLWVL